MTVSAGEHTAIGALSGTTEVILMQPLVAFKNALQEGRSLQPLLRNPVHLYRGLTVSALTCVHVNCMCHTQRPGLSLAVL